MISLDHNVTLMHGDVANALPLIPDNSVEAVITDPPYALDMGGGTSGWDTYKSPADFASWCSSWGAEALRIAKPGAWLVAAGSGATWHRLAQGLEDAGWTIVDSVDWIYSTSLHRAIDIPARLRKGGYPDDLASSYEGRSTFIKSRHEPFVLARAPMQGSVLGTIAEHGTGTIDVVSTASESGSGPCNVVVSHDEFCLAPGEAIDGTVIAEPGWCVPGCPVALLGHRSSLFPVFRWEDKPTTAERPRLEVEAGKGTGKLSTIGEFRRWRCAECGTVTGSYLKSGAKHSSTPHVICAHPDSYEPLRRNDYVDVIAHNTVKPLGLMRWFVRLLTKPGDRILEPFGGSHATVEAAVIERREVIAVERDRTSVDLGQVRMRRQGVRQVDGETLSAPEREVASG